MRPTPFVARISALLAACVLLGIGFPSRAIAQKKSSPPSFPDRLKLGGGPLGGLDLESPKLSVSLSPKSVKAGDTVTLSVTLDLPPGAHVTPQKSKSNFGVPIRFRTKSLSGLTEIDKAFTTKAKPKTKVHDDGEKEVYFEGKITWTKKLRVAKDLNASKVSFAGSIRYQVCTDGLCKPPKTAALTATAAVAGKSDGSQPKAEPPHAKTAGKDKTPKDGDTVFPFVQTDQPVRGKTKDKPGKPDPIKFTYTLSPEGAKVGETVNLSIKADIEDHWHAFDISHIQKPKGIGVPVQIKVSKLQGLIPSGKGWRADKAPLEKRYNGERILEHEGSVVWKRTFKVAPGTPIGAYGVSARIRYQICEGDSRCLTPLTRRFKLGHLDIAQDAPPSANTIDDTPFPVKATARKAADTANLPFYLLLAFCGGLILNVMPCVLPVIAIKVMSFVQQAGEDRGRVFVLNSVYGLGVISVFLLLATLAVFAGYGWGGLFQRAEFTLIMGVIVFAMGLSLLGVYEIPIPGLLGSAAGHQQNEGPGGAFLTGVFATILATPCSGPFLGVTLAWSVQQPAYITYLVWATMGLGMAFPYLVFALYPKATKLLPKPGNWMVRFKEISGFVLMGTTVWILQSLEKPQLFYSLILATACGFSLWLVGQLYMPTTPRPQKWTIRVLALAIVTFAAFAGSHVLPHVKPEGSDLFRFLQRFDLLAAATVFLGVAFAVLPIRAAIKSATTAGRRWLLHAVGTVCVLGAIFGAYFAQTFAELPWQPYTEQKLNDEVAKGNIVLIDFTADW